MKIVLVTDAWHPQVNGVVRTLQTTINILRDWGHQILIISPDQYRNIPAPSYPEIRLAYAGSQSMGRRIAEFDPDAIHLATEGPLCVSARRWCRKNNHPFSTAYHTQFPEYLAKRTKLPAKLFWPYIRWFHGKSQAIMVSTDSVKNQLKEQRLSMVHHWSRGVDLDNFSPSAPKPEIFEHLPKPIQLYVGRVAIEKNIRAFLETKRGGSKVVVGDGPELARLQAEYPDVHFLGRKSGRELAGCYAGADVFVFPSRTDTFGLVLIEALACGVPVAAFEVTGPVDILNGSCGAMSSDLNHAIEAALTKKPEDCIARAQHFSWEKSAQQFLDGLIQVERPSVAPLSRNTVSKPILARA